ncbi:hypothetical protein [Noviherbaspirillum malthae]|jgi:hypothetical protein|uniref:hypothetical protein n=1 Tax=Noviherbaspirillum malthae TaxID=1260987 RepID=UPI00188DEFE3|nr:hypothetical protein [Noviherbaspirillum malthae]
MARMPSAAKVIQDELKQARQAVAFYQKRVEDLEDVLATLSSIDAPVTASRGSSNKKKDVTTTKASSQVASKSRSTKLPATGKDFWPSLLTDKPQSAAEVFKSALAALRIRPTPEDRKKLSQRMSNALSVLSKNGEITAEGSARNRLYSRTNGSAS